MVTALCQIEIQVSDLERAAHFYAEVFGWQKVPAFMHDYMILAGAPGEGYGLSLVMNPRLKPVHSSLILYFQCADLEETAAKAVALGGRVLLAGKRLPSYGTITVVTDPDGHKFGLFKGPALQVAATLE